MACPRVILKANENGQIVPSSILFPLGKSDTGESISHFQVEFKDARGKKWYMDQAERFNAFNFNKFTGWKCNAGYPYYNKRTRR